MVGWQSMHALSLQRPKQPRTNTLIKQKPQYAVCRLSESYQLTVPDHTASLTYFLKCLF